MTHEEFKEKALEIVQYNGEKAITLMQSYSSHETIGGETYEKHLAIFYDRNKMLYILVAQIGHSDPVPLIYDSHEDVIKNYYLLKQ